MKKLLLLTILLLSGCQTTPTAPIVNNIDVPVDVPTSIQALSIKMMGRGAMCDETTNSLTCEVPMEQMASILTQALMVGPRGEAPRNIFKFSFAKIGDGTRVYFYRWLTIRSAYGSEQRTNANVTQDELNRIKQVIMEHTQQ